MAHFSEKMLLVHKTRRNLHWGRCPESLSGSIYVAPWKNYIAQDFERDTSGDQQELVRAICMCISLFCFRTSIDTVLHLRLARLSKVTGAAVGTKEAHCFVSRKIALSISCVHS